MEGAKIGDKNWGVITIKKKKKMKPKNRIRTPGK